MKEKILIENGMIIDGTGSKEYVDSVLLENGLISAIGKEAKTNFRSFVRMTNRDISKRWQ